MKNVINLEDFKNVESFIKESEAPRKGGGSGPHDPDMERRVATLESDVRTIRDTLADIRVLLANVPTKDDVSLIRSDLSPIRADIASIKSSMEGKATNSSVAEIKGQVSTLPTIPKISALMAVGVVLCSTILAIYRFGITHHWW